MNKFLLALVIPSVTLFSCNNINTNTNLNKKVINSNNNQTLLLKIKPNVNQERINIFNKQFGVTNFNYISKDLKIAEIKTDSKNVESLKKEYLDRNIVEYIEKDSKMSVLDYQAENISDTERKNLSIKATTTGARPNDTFFPLQWNMQSIDADKAWTLTTGNSSVTVAVIDSGVDPDHPDLQENLLPLIDMLADTGEVDNYFFGNIDVDYSGKDGNGHGTHVTGVIGALINNQKGVSGLAGNVKILPIKAANFSGGTSASIITKSIIKAIENKVRVINISIGGERSEGTKALKEAVDLALEKGIVFVSATGNESSRSKGIITDVTVPAGYEGVISVAAVTEKDRVANYSNGGPEVEIAAPGGAGLQSEGSKIYSTWPTYKTFEGYRAGIIGPYAYLSGTSMSCPHISAAAALLFSRYPSMTGQQARIRILSTAKEIIGQKGFNSDVGYGKLNVYDALIQGSHDKKEITN
ncbi:MAG: S8 family serine peptidase [Cyanobacteriota bacterium]